MTEPAAGAQAAPADTTPAPAAGGPATTETPAPAAAVGGTAPGPDEHDDVDPRVAKANREAANYRTKLRELEAARKAELAELEKLRAATQTEEERKAAAVEAATKRASDLETQATEAARRAATAENELAVFRAADALRSGDKPLQFHNLSTVLRLIDPADMEPDDSGKRPNVETVLRRIAKEHPYLVAQATTPAGAGSPANPARSSQTSVPTTIEDFRGKPPEFINKHWDAFVKAQAAANGQ